MRMQFVYSKRRDNIPYSISGNIYNLLIYIEMHLKTLKNMDMQEEFLDMHMINDIFADSCRLYGIQCNRMG